MWTTGTQEMKDCSSDMGEISSEVKNWFSDMNYSRSDVDDRSSEVVYFNFYEVL